MPRAEKRALSVPLRPTAAAPGCGRTWSDLAGLRPPPLAHRSVSLLLCGRAHIHTLTRPTRSRRGQPGTHRAARTHSFWCRTLRTRPARHWLPRPAARAAPPTFPDRGDAGSALRVALRGGGRPDQLQQQPQREPGPGQSAGNAGSRGAEGGASGRRRCHPRSERRRRAARLSQRPSAS